MAVSETKSIKVLPRRVIQQPEPLINPGGDCGVCVAGGVIVGQTNPGKVAVEDAYGMRDGDEGPRSISRYKMIEILNEGRHQGMVEDYIEDIPMWAPDPWHAEWLTRWDMANKWFRYYKMAIRAGYYGMAQVNSDGKGVNHGTDHWVLICGFRERHVLNHRLRNNESETLRKSRIVKMEILISNSSRAAKDERWIEAHEFLRRFGGYNALLVLPTPNRAEDSDYQQNGESDAVV